MVRLFGWKFIDDFAWVRQGFPGRFPNRFKNAHEPVLHFANTNRPKIRPSNVVIPAEKTNQNDSQAAVYGVGETAVMGQNYEGETGNNVTAANLNGGALPSNVITAYRTPNETAVKYGATFPVGLPDFFIRAFSDPGDTWLDIFAGTSTTAEACEQNGRLCYCIDNNPTAIQKSLERFKLIGLEPIPVEEFDYDRS